MPLFKRRRAEIPEWSPLSDPDDWQAFSALATEACAARGWNLDLEEGWATDGQAEFGLFNLAGKCGQAPREEWPAVVDDHFTAIAAMAERDADGGRAKFADADAARAVLKARLVTDDFFGGDGRERLQRRVAEDLVLVAAYDLPDSVEIPEREDMLQWGDAEELLELAVSQTRAEPGLELERHEIPGPGDEPSSPLFALSGDSFFTASHAIWAAEFDPPESPHGTLVSVPVRNLVLAHPIRDGRVLGMIAPMLELTSRYYAEGPGSLSPSVYWLREERMERLNAWIDEDGPHITPSPEFLKLLESF